MQIPLALKAGDYNSIRSKGQLINLIAETNKAQDYVTVRRTEGLTLLHTTPNDEPMRSQPHLNGSFIYYVAGDTLYRFQPPSGAPVSLGTVGGSGRATILSNSVPGNNQIVILNGEGQGYIYDNSGLNQIVDADFYDTTSMTILNERFWFTRDGSNEFFASDVADASAYNPLSFGTAEWKPDDVEIVVSKKSALWVIGTTTLEYYQSADDPIFPLRAVRGASFDIGILASNSFAELDDYFAFLADNSNIALVYGTELTYISDLEFTTKIRGDGTPQNPGFTDAQIQACIGFFVDTPQHKVYYLTFPTASYTWGYDLMTGMTLTRSSLDGLAWRAVYSLTFQNQVYIGDRVNGSVWLFDPDAKSEGDGILAATMITPSISFPVDAFISEIAVEMEVGVAEAPGDNPLMIVYNSKNGGKTWILHSHIPLGGWGDYNKRVILRNFGRIVRREEFVLKFIVTDAVRVQFYEITSVEDFDA
jgi:hypothetical protein